MVMKEEISEEVQAGGTSRRDFFKSVGTVSAAMAAMPKAVQSAEAPQMPMVRWKDKSISRLICGSNIFGGLSHWSAFINREMRAWYTPEQIVNTYRRCTEVGINTFEPLSSTTPGLPARGGPPARAGAPAAPARRDSYAELAKEGIKIQGFLRGQGDPARVEAMAKTPGVIGIHHYGVATDNWFKQGQLDTARDYVKRIRDTGLLVGVAAHMPDAIAEVESQNWDIDYYMCCVYQWGRTKEEFEKLAGNRKDLLPIETYSVIAREGYSEVFLSGDPPKMFNVIKKVKKPCLVYKILGAGRRCETPETTEAAFKEAFENIKPTDAIIVGMYTKYTDQPAEDAALVRKYGTVAS
jgi:hypothetical protein